jgi:hypothetical protein
VSLNTVAVEPVLDTTVDHVLPLLTERCTLYPVIAEPPLLDGAVQDRLICDDDTAVVPSPVGGDGTVVLLGVVADDMFDGALDPAELIADTLYV